MLTRSSVGYIGYQYLNGKVSGQLALLMEFQYTAKIGQASWRATWEVVTTGYGAAGGIVGLADGQLEQNDVWNLLSLLPVAAATLGSVKFFGAARQVKTAPDAATSTPGVGTGSTNNAIDGLGQA